MKYWLCKTEPSDYSFDDLERDRSTRWDGVRNPTALIHLRTMAVGDGLVIYHTGDVRAAIGTAEVTSAPYADPAHGDPRWTVVDIVVGLRMALPVTLAEVKHDPRFADSPLVRIGRLSVVPLTAEQFAVLTRG